MSTGRTSAGPALADTSVFIGLENARFDEEKMPASVSVSVITIAELRLGVLIASSVSDRARRPWTPASKLRHLAGEQDVYND